MKKIIKGFPKCIRKDIKRILKILQKQTYNDARLKISDTQISYVLNGEEIMFPYRIYIIDISDDELNKYNELEKNIIHCIYTRSFDGYVRERHLKELLNTNYNDWTIPYIVKICDEYIIEILELTYSILKNKNTEKIKSFCVDNRITFCRSYNRMISYWNEYYRNISYEENIKNYPNFKDYIGKKLFEEIFGYTCSMKR